MFRKIIYIGEANGQAVYFDTKNKLALAAPKSSLLDTKRSQKHWKYIIVLLIILFALRLIHYLVPLTNPFTTKYTLATLIYLFLIWSIEIIGFPFLIERALYKNVKTALPTNKQVFRTAIYSNLFWNNFSDKKVSKKKKCWAWCFTLIMTVVSLTAPAVGAIAFKMLGKNIGSEMVMISFLGLLPAVTILLIWQNNIIRWLTVVEYYQNRKITWK